MRDLRYFFGCARGLKQGRIFRAHCPKPLCIGTPVVGFDIGGVGEILAAMFPRAAMSNQDSEALCSTIAAVLADASVTVAENTEFLLSNMCTQTCKPMRN